LAKQVLFFRRAFGAAEVRAKQGVPEMEVFIPIRGCINRENQTETASTRDAKDKLALYC
jgi:hypothetical protein